MTALAYLLFGAFAGAVLGLVAVNMTVLTLRILRRPNSAERISKAIEPFISYLRLGGKSREDSLRVDTTRC